ncbi:IS3 family transposase [Corynebacterium diphtheriae]|nr:IS3 family transposase [Corynebacterium diphtheriae]CAB0996370.1 IS3 family transposase [Corynebacterium diphtheriae]
MSTAFVTDVFSWRIIGWVLLDSMRTSSLAAASTKPGHCVCQGNDGFDSPLRPRLTRWIQLVVYNERLAEHGIVASTGTVGDSYDNALAENVNGPSQERTDSYPHLE